MVYSMLDIFTAVVCTRTGNSELKVGCRGYPHPSADILAAALKVAVKTRKTGKLY